MMRLVAARLSFASRTLRLMVILGLGLSGGILIALCPDIAVPATILFLPSLITLLMDPSPHQRLSQGMLLFQAAAVAAPLRQAWYSCSGLHGCAAFLLQPGLILHAWLAAMLAWLLTQVLPIGVKLWDDVRLRRRREELVQRRRVVTEEWGLEDRPDG